MERCSDVSQGECTLLASLSAASEDSNTPSSGTPNRLANKSCQGVCRIVAMDDEYVWASTSSSSVNMWRDVGKRTRRVPNFRPSGIFDEEPFGKDASDNEDELDMDGLETNSPMEENGPSTPATMTTASMPRSASLKAPPNPPRSSSEQLEPPTSSSFSKRLSFDLPDVSLGPTRSRDSQSVAFAPGPPTTLSPPNERAISFHVNTPPNENYTSSLIRNLRKNRVNTISAAESNNSSNASTLDHDVSQIPQTTSITPPLFNDIPYESLVNLGSLDSPYGLFSFAGRRTDAEIATIYSAASVLSIPHYARHHSDTNHARDIFGTSATETDQPLLSSAMSTRSNKDFDKEARLDFEAREELEAAVPVRKKPEAVIEGKHGLVRSLILNDKQHVVTCDTAGGALDRLPSMHVSDNEHRSHLLVNRLFFSASQSSLSGLLSFVVASDSSHLKRSSPHISPLLQLTKT